MRNVDEKLDKLVDGQAEQNVMLARIQVDLAHHIKRSDSHEIHLKLNDKKINMIMLLIMAGIGASAKEFVPLLLKLIGAS